MKILIKVNLSLNILEIFNMTLEQVTQKIISSFHHSSYEEFALGNEEHQKKDKNKLKHLVEELSKEFDEHSKQRLMHEFFEHGPLEELLSAEEITEIIVNAPDSIYFEKNGKLTKHSDQFLSSYTYERYIDRLCDLTETTLNLDRPFVDSKFKNFRISLTDKSVTHSSTSINFRRHPLSQWTFEKLVHNQWCSPEVFASLRKIIDDQSNFLIIGPTGSGKTSVLNSFLDLTKKNERSVIIEDTSEIPLPNSSSMKLITRCDAHQIQKEITQTDLVKRSLRLRPDRIIMGEIRGGEAKDFLMALSTGHQGSFGTLHASDPHQALLRLEMLIQMGAPHWSLTAIRRLIFLSLEYIVITTKNSQGQRVFAGAYQLSSLEENGFLIERKF